MKLHYPISENQLMPPHSQCDQLNRYKNEMQKKTIFFLNKE